jgi:hypothetical protein
MKKIFAFVLLGVSVMISSCDKKGGDNRLPEVVTEGVYILNNGNYASNDASLSSYDPDNRILTPNVFLSANGKKLGDQAQDMLIYGDKMYIAVYNSRVIFVTDRQGKIIKELKVTKDDVELSPRALIGHGSKVYATMYEGYLAQIDTVKYSTKIVKVGDNPEGLIAVENKVYVANSGGMNYPVYGNTVSVVDVQDVFQVSSIINVVENPTKLLTNIRGEIFLVSWGNFGDVPNTLQRIDPRSHDVMKLTDKPVTYMAMGSDSKLYFISSQYDENGRPDISVGVYNTLSATMEADFIVDGTVIKNSPVCISVDPVDGRVYIGTSDYVSEGDMYVFTKDGNLENKFSTGGLNPIGAYFLLGVE